MLAGLGEGVSTEDFIHLPSKAALPSWTCCGAASLQEQRDALPDCSREYFYLLCHPSASSDLKFPGPVLQAAPHLIRGEMCLLGKPFLYNKCHCRSWHFHVTAHIHESVHHISSRSSLLHHLRSFQPKKMTFPGLLPPVLLEASAPVIPPSETLTSILLMMGGKGAPNAAFSTILHLSVSVPASLSSQVARKEPRFLPLASHQVTKLPWKLNSIPLWEVLCLELGWI